MFDKSTLENITILYVEDDLHIRESIVKIFDKFFTNTYVANNGQDGLEMFKQLKQDNINIDLIISDINMSHMNGLEMIKSVKEIDHDIPFILTTAYAETEYFMEAIALGVTHYVIKPLVIKDLIIQIQNVGLRKYQELVIKNQQKENKQYIDIIDKIAIVSKADLKGHITFVNDIFCDISGYTKDELIGQNHNIVRHPDVAKKVFKELWNDLKDGKVWRGKIKNKAKNGEPYIVNATIFPVFDKTGKNIVEYMAVRFVITEDELEKRKFKKNVITNIKEQKEIVKELKTQIKELEKKLKISDYDSLKMIQDSLDIERKKVVKIKTQLSHYEIELKKEKRKNAGLVKASNSKMTNMVSSSRAEKEKMQKYQDKMLNLQLDVKSQLKEIARLTAMLEEQSRQIKDLKDVIEHREEQLEHK